MENSGIPWIGDVPKSWKIVRNKDVFNNSKTLVGENWINTQLLSLTTKGIKPVAIGSTSGKVPDSYETYQVVEKDNLVMCLFDLDCSAVFSGLSPICGMISPAYKALTIKKGYSPDFYAKWFDYIFDGRKFMFLSKNIRYSLTYDEFAALQIVAPSLSEQQRIAEFLDRKCAEVDEMIGLQEQIIEELKAYKQSVITEAVTKGLNPNVSMRDSGIEWIGQIPEHWELSRIRNLGITQNGISKGSEFFGEGEPFVSYGDVYKNLELPSIASGLIQSSQEEQERFSVCKGDVFFTRTSETIEEIGFSSTCTKTIERAVYAGFLIRFRPKQGVFIDDFSKYYFRSNVHRAYFVKEMNIVTRASLSQDLLKSLPVLLPPLAEQQAIADYLDEKCADIDSLIQTKLSKIDSLKEYKKSIIYEYVTGKKEVNE